jgi:hypothetical protein
MAPPAGEIVQWQGETRYDVAPLSDADRSWDLDDWHVEAKLEKVLSAAELAAYARTELEQVLGDIDQSPDLNLDQLDGLSRRLRSLTRYLSCDLDARNHHLPEVRREAIQRRLDEQRAVSTLELIGLLWTAAQAAATAVTLGAAVASGTRKWRQKRTKLPPGSLISLTITTKDNHYRERAKVVIYDVHTKTVDDITDEIRQALTAYAQRGVFTGPVLSDEVRSARLQPEIDIAAVAKKINEQLYKDYL